MEQESLQEIYKQAIADPTLLSTIDVDALLEKIGENNYLEGKTLENISEEIYETLNSIEKLEKENLKIYCLRLMGYQLIDRICDLRNGRLIRWVKLSNGTLTNGGLLMNVKIENKGVILLCKNNTNRFFNVRFDDCIVFQKLSMEEQIILMANSQ
jgi:hypothetical protein